jgi:TRAP-type mannitol/chloroaromatic compound transport system, small permease component
MNAYVDFADGLNRQIARFVKWLAIAMLLVQFGVVLGRYVFGVNSIAVQEFILYMHATLFMLGAAYTLQVDKHVRVDIFYASMSPERQRLVDILGHIVFLIPSMLALIYWSWPSVANSWAILEGPISVGGIKAVFLLKSLIPLFAATLILQSLAQLVKLVSGKAA